MAVHETTRVELMQLLDCNEDIYILEVREPHEYQICHINGHLLPLGELPARVHELNSADDIVVHCRSGVRSGKAVDFLRKAGFRKGKNLKGGILACSDQEDPSVPKHYDPPADPESGGVSSGFSGVLAFFCRLRC